MKYEVWTNVSFIAELGDDLESAKREAREVLRDHIQEEDIQLCPLEEEEED